MKNVTLLILLCLIILLNSCIIEKNKIVGDRLFPGYHHESLTPNEVFELIPRRKELKKNDLYYHQLLDQINYNDIYYADEKSLNEKFKVIADILDSFLAEYDFSKISQDTIGCYDRIIYAAFEYRTSEEGGGETEQYGEYPLFFKEELFDKYVYFLFNLKVDFNYVTGYSPSQCGVWSSELGFGDNAYYPIVQEVIEKENDVYEVEMLYGYDDYEQENKPFVPCWKSVYSFSVDGQRIFINKITVLEKYTEDFDSYYAWQVN
ncbi:MAG TPA: hypothetical protein PKH29_12465 [Oscillospiraceae bacterium]|nr:hypothetical protein [Oscillospiraceae bacterium]